MIKFWHHQYALTPRFALSALTAEDTPREGALLKIQWPDKKIGYADCFPWPELGDDPVSTHIEGLRKGRISQIVEQSIWLGRQDALARADNRSLMVDSKLIKNHFIVADFSKVSESVLTDVKAEGYTTLKIKVGRDISSECQWLDRIMRKHPQFNIRLDFNANKDSRNFEKFVSFFSAEMRKRIDFVEDPFPYDRDAWHEAAKLVPLALDNEFSNVKWDKEASFPFRVLIYKPARQDQAKIIDIMNTNETRMVITSVMDHPVGMAHAIRVASELKRMFRNRVLECGCMTQTLFWPNDFSKEMQVSGPVLTGIPGTGVGFDNLLEALPWKPLHQY